MALESGNLINQLVTSNPTGADPRRQGDDHLRLLKSVLKNTFQGSLGTGFDAPITADPADLNRTAVESNWIPSGVIVMWNGTIATIPTGWQLCDGTGGSPDLRNRFVIGADADAGGTDDVGDTGGSRNATGATVTAAHSLTSSQIPNHIHQIRLTTVGSSNTGAGTAGLGLAGGGSTNRLGTEQSTTDGGGGTTGAGHTHNISFNGTNANLPPYYALAYIVKL